MGLENRLLFKSSYLESIESHIKIYNVWLSVTCKTSLKNSLPKLKHWSNVGGPIRLKQKSTWILRFLSVFSCLLYISLWKVTLIHKCFKWSLTHFNWNCSKSANAHWKIDFVGLLLLICNTEYIKQLCVILLLM